MATQEPDLSFSSFPDDFTWDILEPTPDIAGIVENEGWVIERVATSFPDLPRVFIYFVVATNLVPEDIVKLSSHTMSMNSLALTQATSQLMSAHVRWATSAWLHSTRRMLLHQDSKCYSILRARVAGNPGCLSFPAQLHPTVLPLEQSKEALRQLSSGVDGKPNVFVIQVANDTPVDVPTKDQVVRTQLHTPEEAGGSFTYLIGGHTLCPHRDVSIIQDAVERGILSKDGHFAPMEWCKDDNQPTDAMPPFSADFEEHPGPLG